MIGLVKRAERTSEGRSLASARSSAFGSGGRVLQFAVALLGILSSWTLIHFILGTDFVWLASLGAAMGGLLAWGAAAWLTASTSRVRDEIPDTTRSSLWASRAGLALIFFAFVQPLIVSSAVSSFASLALNKLAGIATIALLSMSYVAASGFILLSAGMFGRLRIRASLSLYLVGWIWAALSTYLILWSIGALLMDPLGSEIEMIAVGFPGVCGFAAATAAVRSRR